MLIATAITYGNYHEPLTKTSMSFVKMLIS